MNVSDVCSQGYLIFICTYTIAVIPSFDRNGNLSSYFLFDSHSRNDCGTTTCKTAFSVLLQFPKYLEVAYKITNRSYPIYFQFQYLNVNIRGTDLKYIQDSFRKERKRTAKQNMRLEEHFSKFENHEIIKEKIKQQILELNSNIGFSKYKDPRHCDKMQQASLKLSGTETQINSLNAKVTII